jgi:tRNA-binding protein
VSRRKRETTFDTFERLQILGGKVVSVEHFPEARKPSYRLSLDFGEPVGVLRSSAQLTRRYGPGELLGRTLLAVVNFPAKRVAGFASECLVLGLVNPEDPGDVVLVRPDTPGTKGWELG